MTRREFMAAAAALPGLAAIAGLMESPEGTRGYYGAPDISRFGAVPFTPRWFYFHRVGACWSEYPPLVIPSQRFSLEGSVPEEALVQLLLNQESVGWGTKRAVRLVVPMVDPPNVWSIEFTALIGAFAFRHREEERRQFVASGEIVQHAPPFLYMSAA